MATKILVIIILTWFSTTQQQPFGPLRTRLAFNSPCAPDSVENGAYYDALLAGRISNEAVDIEDPNGPGWSAPFEEAYVQYLSARPLFSVTERGMFTDKIGTEPVCDFSKLLFCYHTESIEELFRKNRTTGLCGYDHFHATTNGTGPGNRPEVIVGHPCSFLPDNNRPSGMTADFLFKSSSSYRFECSKDSAEGDLQAVCKPFTSDDRGRTDSLEVKLQMMAGVSGINFTGLGLRTPFRNYLVRWATGVCGCAARHVANTKGGCVKGRNTVGVNAGDIVLVMMMMVIWLIN